MASIHVLECSVAAFTTRSPKKATLAKVIVHKSRSEQFFNNNNMEQKLRFGLVLGRLAIQKKNGPIMIMIEQLLWAFFSYFIGILKKNIVASAFKSCIKGR